MEGKGKAMTWVSRLHCVTCGLYVYWGRHGLGGAVIMRRCIVCRHGLDQGLKIILMLMYVVRGNMGVLRNSGLGWV